MIKRILTGSVRKNNSNGEFFLPLNIKAIKLFLSVAAVFIVGFILQYAIKANLAVFALLIVLYSYLKFSEIYSDIKSYNLLDIILLYTITLSTSFFIFDHGYSVFCIPFCVIPMLSVILFNDLRVSLVLTIVGALTIASLAGNNLNLGLLFLISGISSVILAFGARKRSIIMRTGFILGLIQVITLLLIEGVYAKDANRFVVLFLNGIVSSIIVIGILPVFEYLFKIVTNISLLELADFNHPLLQRLTLEAPGTYHHSLLVGNLSDAACQAVGANALLARIGAYYHDIGKLSKPEYFSENQSMQLNKHDALSPTMSKLVIMNHVKEGVDLAKKYKLNKRLVEFIQGHHGNSLVFYTEERWKTRKRTRK
jgi:putative nucleotidyltransferase with HDIG domain